MRSPKLRLVIPVGLMAVVGCGGSDTARIAELEQQLAELQSTSTTPAVSTTTPTEVAQETTLPQPPTTSSTTSTTTTTLPTTASPESEQSFIAFAESREAIDWSKQIETPCGVFGLLVLGTQIELYQWDGAAWSDRSELLGPDSEMVPSHVKSHDFDGDGYLDLFVQYRDPNDGSLLGSLFFQRECDWGWATFIDSLDVWSSEVVSGLYWSSARGGLEATTENWDGYRTYLTVSFDEERGVFRFVDVPFNPPPKQCVDSLAWLRRENSSDFVRSWEGRAVRASSGWLVSAGVGSSLQNCRRDDWIIEAERKRSEFDNHTDAQYYGESYVLLSNESAESVLEKLCTVMNTGQLAHLRAFNSGDKIACDGY